jgi:hypothetical protein
MKKQPQTLLSKYNMQVNEVVRQLISGTIGLVSYFGGGELTRALVNRTFKDDRNALDDATKQVAMIAGGVAASFIGFAFVRPYVSTELICKFLKREEGIEARFSEGEVQSILKQAQTSIPDTLSHSQVLALLEQEKSAQIAQQAGVKSKHWLMEPVQRWIDQHLVPKGNQDLAKVVRYSTLGLAGYLTALTLGLWGINRLLGSNGKQTVAPQNRQIRSSQPAHQVFMAPSQSLEKMPVHPMMMGSRPTMSSLGSAKQLEMPWRIPAQGLTQVW